MNGTCHQNKHICGNHFSKASSAYCYLPVIVRSPHLGLHRVLISVGLACSARLRHPYASLFKIIRCSTQEIPVLECICPAAMCGKQNQWNFAMVGVVKVCCNLYWIVHLAYRSRVGWGKKRKKTWDSAAVWRDKSLWKVNESDNFDNQLIF